MRVDERGIDPEFEQAIGVRSTFAAIAVGDGPSHVIAFSIDGQVDDERVLYSLTAVRHVVNLKLEQLGVTRMLEESRLIQESMLPSGPPPFPGSTSTDAHGPPTASGAICTTTCRCRTAAWALRSPTPQGTACPRRSWCATSSPACGSEPVSTGGSPRSSRGSTG